MDKIAEAEAIELAELDVNRLIDVMRKQGLTCRSIMRILLIRCEQLACMADEEYYLRG